MKISIHNTILFNFSILFCAVIIILLAELYPESQILCHIMGSSSVIIMVILTHHFRKNSSMFVVMFFIAYSIYSIYIAVYVDKTFLPDLYKQFTDKIIYTQSLECIYVFTILLYVLINCTPSLKNQKNIRCNIYEKVQIHRNKIIALICIVIILFISLTNYSFTDIKTRAKGTPIFEYKVIFFIIGMIFTKESKNFRRLWFVLMIIIGSLSFIGGNRADAIPIVLTYIYFHFNHIPTKKLYLYVLSSILAMISIGAFRQTLLLGGFSISTLYRRIVNEKFTFDTAYWAYVPTLSTLSLKRIIPLSDKFDLFIGQIQYVFLGGKYNNFKLELFSRKFYAHVNGFVSPAYFYFWFNLFGSVIFSVLVYLYIRLTYKNDRKITMEKNVIKSAVSCYFVAMTPRWFLYDPYSLIRGELIVVIISNIFIIIDKITRRIYWK